MRANSGRPAADMVDRKAAAEFCLSAHGRLVEQRHSLHRVVTVLSYHTYVHLVILRHKAGHLNGASRFLWRIRLAKTFFFLGMFITFAVKGIAQSHAAEIAAA